MELKDLTKDELVTVTVDMLFILIGRLEYGPTQKKLKDVMDVLMVYNSKGYTIKKTKESDELRNKQMDLMYDNKTKEERK